MGFYLNVEENKIVNCSNEDKTTETVKSIPVDENTYYNFIKNEDRYIYQDGKIIEDTSWEEREKVREKERIGNLTISKREFALYLQKIGISYAQIKELIATNEQAQLEWDLCIVLERKNQLLDIMAAKLGVTSEMLDKIFKFANGELDSLE